MNIYMNISCCMGCTKRTVGCHGTCETYLEERKMLDMKKEERYKKLAISSVQYNGLLKGKRNG